MGSLSVPTFGQWLKQRREERDLTQAELARLVGCSAVAIRKLEAGTRRPSKQVAELLAQAFELPAAQHAEFVRCARSNSPFLPQAESDERLPVHRKHLPHRASNLPALPTPLIGRETEIAAALDYVRGERVRLLTFTGPPGVGKTSLALKVAAEARAAFADGVCFVPLAQVRDPDLALAAIGQAAGWNNRGTKSVLSELAALLQDEAMLLVLDNLEQVVSVAPQLADLLGACPALKIIATSREALRVRGEQQFPIAPLAFPRISPLPDAKLLLRWPAVALFVERAQAVCADFALSPENAETVARICRRVEGLPLAIELAAAQIQLYTPHEIETRLARRLYALPSGMRDLPARHKTLGKAIQWSYELLEPAEKELFAGMGVFAGGCTRPAVEAVTGAAANLDGPLAALVSKSLLVRQERDGETRLTMLETIREYAAECLAASGAEPRMRRRHAEYYAGLAHEAGPELTGHDQQTWFRRLEHEHDNIRAALRWALESGANEIAVEICASIWRFWGLGDLAEGRRWLERALAQSDGVSPERRAEALTGAGAIAWVMDDCGAARAFYEASLSLYREAHNLRGVAYALRYLANLTRDEGHYTESEAYYEESLALLGELGDQWGMARVYMSMGAGRRYQGDEDGSMAMYERGLELSRRLDDKKGIEICIAALGHVEQARGNYRLAAEHLCTSLNLSQELGDKTSIADSFADLACLATSEKQFERAARLLGAAQALLDATRYQMDQLGRLQFESTLAAAKGQLGAAFDAAWSAGYNMEMDAAIAYAIAGN